MAAKTRPKTEELEARLFKLLDEALSTMDGKNTVSSPLSGALMLAQTLGRINDAERKRLEDFFQTRFGNIDDYRFDSAGKDSRGHGIWILCKYK